MVLSNNRLIAYFTLCLGLLLLAGCQGNDPNLQTMLINLQSSYPNLWRLLTATAYVVGFFFILRAIHYMKVYGEMRTMMASNASVKTPVTLIIVGSALIYAPTAFQTLMMTTFGSANVTPLSYAGHYSGWSNQATVALLGLVQIIGLIAFIRGWIFLARAGEQSSQPGAFGKGMTHIIGGLLAINIVGTWDVIKATLGYS